MNIIRIEGADEAARVMDELSRDFPKRTISAGMRAAGKPYIARLKGGVAKPSFRKLAGVRTYTRGKTPLTAIGLFGGRGKKVHRPKRKRHAYMSMWFIEYWLNNGTLEKRHPGHPFGNARKRKSEDWKGGIDPTRMAEKAWSQSRGAVVAAIPSSMRAAADRYVARLEKKQKRI